MEIKLVAPPGDSMWWVLRPEFVSFLDKIVIDKRQYQKEENEKERSGYHKLVWDRITVLGEEDVLELTELELDAESIGEDANTIVSDIYSKSERMKLLIKDMIFAYRYWVDFNKLKIELLPKNQQYRKEIVLSMPKWDKDLETLLSSKADEFLRRPNIRGHVVTNIIEKVVTLKHLNRDLGQCSFASLKEYEPFTKYLDCEFDSPLVTEHIA